MKVCRKWREESTGVFCCMMSMHAEAPVVGFVAVLPGHPWFGRPAGEIDATADGARLTIAIDTDDDGADRWWVGFESHREIDFVRREVHALARQAFAAAG
jgi:hypothetical protein